MRPRSRNRKLKKLEEVDETEHKNNVNNSELSRPSPGIAFADGSHHENDLLVPFEK